ncbi:MAG TPA: hypothetical protein VL175_11225 [Pirellulales bacterium]|jgi:hypothetical protein|nr:hypothetical protein [Pirellulales bacterium]
MNDRSPRLSARMAVLSAVLVAGCSQAPQVGPENYPLIESLRTAVSARNEDWLADNARLISERHQKGQLDDQQYAEFEAIIAQARTHDWSGAETRVIALAKAQRPVATSTAAK